MSLKPTSELADAASAGAGLSANVARSPAAGRAFSDAGPLPLAPAGVQAPRAAGDRDSGPGAISSLLVIGGVAAALFAATAGSARVRRLWAVVRRRTA